MRRRNLVIGIFSSIALSACSQGWQTAYDNNPSVGQSADWSVKKIVVSVPGNLSVSEADLFSPNADIVWRGEPLGDRRAQVRRMFIDAATLSVASITDDGRAVDLHITVNHFHATTEKTRTTFNAAGVHNISFAINILDSNTSAVLASEADVDADLVAFSGETARVAEAAGQTQRVRIVQHLAQVISGWLGTGPDVRKSFSRVGR